jgi:hypothetical protein
MGGTADTGSNAIVRELISTASMPDFDIGDRLEYQPSAAMLLVRRVAVPYYYGWESNLLQWQ